MYDLVLLFQPHQIPLWLFVLIISIIFCFLTKDIALDFFFYIIGALRRLLR